LIFGIKFFLKEENIGDGKEIRMEDIFYKFLKYYNFSPEWAKQITGSLYRMIPLSCRYGRVFKYYYNLIPRSEKWSEIEINNWYIQKFNEVLNIALNNTRFYPKYYKENGVNITHIKSLDDVERLPMISKKHLRANKEDFLNSMISKKKLIYTTTGGTSGVPIELFWVKGRERSREIAFITRMWERIGYDFSKKLAVLRGNVVDYRGRGKYFSFDPIKNRLFMSSYHLTEEKIPIYIEKLLNFQPDYIHTYPSAITVIAKYLKEHKIRIPGLKGLFCSSESFYPGQRELIENAFKTRVFSWYGHSEMAVLAGECEYNSDYHVFHEYGYLELVDNKGKVIKEPGVQGEIVGTSFEMKAMPLIRYRTGDYAEYVEGKCSCGRSYRLIRNVKGRWTQEQIVTKKGSYISITALNMHSDIFDNVEQYQFYQEKPGELFLRIVKKGNYCIKDEKKIREEFRLKLQNFVDLKIVYVDRIPRTERGKHKFLIQKLKILDY